MDVYRAETGRVGCVPAGTPRAAGPRAPPTAFRQAVVPAPRVHRDAFPVHLPTPTASKVPETTTMPADAMHPAGVRVRVQSVALNFRDFLVAMGLYPSAVDPASMGSDFAGTIVDVGIKRRPECSLRIGDRVFGQSKGVFKDRISVAAELVAPVPSVVTAEEASTLSTVFLTAVHCIKFTPPENVSGRC
jgi:polyketide synthase 2